MSVDLPLPLGPRMATCSPDSMERLRRFRARRPPRSTQTFFSSSRVGKIKVEGSSWLAMQRDWGFRARPHGHGARRRSVRSRSPCFRGFLGTIRKRVPDGYCWIRSFRSFRFEHQYELLAPLKDILVAIESMNGEIRWDRVRSLHIVHAQARSVRKMSDRRARLTGDPGTRVRKARGLE